MSIPPTLINGFLRFFYFLVGFISVMENVTIEGWLSLIIALSVASLVGLVLSAVGDAVTKMKF